MEYEHDSTKLNMFNNIYSIIFYHCTKTSKHTTFIIAAMPRSIIYIFGLMCFMKTKKKKVLKGKKLWQIGE